VKYDYLNVMCSNGHSVGHPVTFRCHVPVELENKEICGNLQDDQKVSVHLMITIQKVTRNVQSVPRQSPDIY
jgi:hypothetical protein